MKFEVFVGILKYVESLGEEFLGKDAYNALSENLQGVEDSLNRSRPLDHSKVESIESLLHSKLTLRKREDDIFKINFTKEALSYLEERFVGDRSGWNFSLVKGSPDSLEFLEEGDELYASPMMSIYMDSIGPGVLFLKLEDLKQFIEIQVAKDKVKYGRIVEALESVYITPSLRGDIHTTLSTIYEEYFYEFSNIMKYFDKLCFKHAEGNFTKEEMERCNELEIKYGGW